MSKRPPSPIPEDEPTPKRARTTSPPPEGPPAPPLERKVTELLDAVRGEYEEGLRELRETENERAEVEQLIERLSSLASDIACKTRDFEAERAEIEKMVERLSSLAATLILGLGGDEHSQFFSMSARNLEYQVRKFGENEHIDYFESTVSTLQYQFLTWKAILAEQKRHMEIHLCGYT